MIVWVVTKCSVYVDLTDCLLAIDNVLKFLRISVLQEAVYEMWVESGVYLQLHKLP